jgi:hypothetical protein
MANQQTTSDLWDDTDDVPHYPKATRRRVALAHALGLVGVLGTLALAVAAFAPRVPGVVASARALYSDEPLVIQPRHVQQVEPRPANPPTALPIEPPPPIEPPAAQAPVAVPAPPAPATSTPSVANSLAVANSVATSASPAAPSEPVVSPPAAPATTATSPAVAPLAASPAVSTATTAPAAAVSLAASPATTPPAASATARHTAPARFQRPVQSEPKLTWHEIERRKERYAEWLKEQHLEPVH